MQGGEVQWTMDITSEDADAKAVCQHSALHHLVYKAANHLVDTTTMVSVAGLAGLQLS